ncbi:MAG TPA: type II toxin-antitoxin system VapC family toxin [Acidobacteriaceae bacterium]
MYLLDTNVISETRKPRPHGAVLAWLNVVRPEDLCLSAITLLELQQGAERTRRQNQTMAQRLDHWIASLTATMAIVSADGDVCRETARIMVSKSPDLFQDAFIAATARVHHLTVVTRNVRDFAHFDVLTFNPFAYSH